MYIFRDFSYSEKDDFRLHVLPLLGNRGGRRQGRYELQGEHRQTGFFVTGWHVIEGAIMNDSSYPNSNTNLDPSRGYHGW